MSMDFHLPTLKHRWLTDIHSKMEFCHPGAFDSPAWGVCTCSYNNKSSAFNLSSCYHRKWGWSDSIYYIINKSGPSTSPWGTPEMTGMHWLTLIFHSGVPTVHWQTARFLACVLQWCCEIVFLEVCQTFIQITIISRYGPVHCLL